MFGKSAIELGKDVVSGFDGEERKAVYITCFKANTRIQGNSNFTSQARIQETE
jgi:hypothetical protein